MRKKRAVSGGGNWMDTYGDMVTLLLTFFVCLYSMSTLNDTQWSELVKAFNPDKSVSIEPIIFEVSEEEGNDAKENREKENQPPEPEPEQPAVTEPTAPEEPKEKPVFFKGLYDILNQHINNSEYAENILIEQDDETGTIYLQFNNKLLFNPDSADLLPESQDALNVVGNALVDNEVYIGKVLIKGYTAEGASDVDAWQLSADRALQILNYFEFEKSFPENKLMFSGFGHLYPVAPNDTEENKAKNRRVEIVITPKLISGSANDFDGSYFADKAKIDE